LHVAKRCHAGSLQRRPDEKRIRATIPTRQLARRSDVASFEKGNGKVDETMSAFRSEREKNLSGSAS
ncbi:MAG TPA: hypothetical protein VK389_02495, partial [Thermoanaerobaculia bacterium]|nr:hypothetical protein [Thermoanaerobaculia bacterium]